MKMMKAEMLDEIFAALERKFQSDAKGRIFFFNSKSIPGIKLWS